MRNVHKIVALMALAVTGIPSCRPDNTLPAPTTPLHKKQLFAGLRSVPQVYSVAAGTEQIVWGSKGTRLEFYPSSFTDAAGNVIASGTVKIELTEMYTPGDMIANYASTTADGKLLRSGGQVYIKATMNGAEVYANKYSIGYKQEQRQTALMELFYGNTNNADSMVNWVAAAGGKGTNSDSSTARIADSSVIDSITGGPLYNLYFKFDSCTSFNWVNCDAFYTSSTVPTAVYIKLGEAFTFMNTAVYCVVKEFNSVVSLYSNTPPGLFASYGMPIGKVVKLVAIGKVGADYFYYESAALTVTENMQIEATPVKINQADISAKLREL